MIYYNNISNPLQIIDYDKLKFLFNYKDLVFFEKGLISSKQEENFEPFFPNDEEVAILLKEYEDFIDNYVNSDSLVESTNEELLTLLSDIEIIKQEKIKYLKFISNKFRTQQVNKDMYIISSLGFRADADKDSQTNIIGLIDLLGDSDNTTLYRDKDDTNHELNKEQLSLLLKEIQANSTNLFQQRWAKEELINKATSFTEVKDVSLDFNMLDFSLSDSGFKL